MDSLHREGGCVGGGTRWEEAEEGPGGAGRREAFSRGPCAKGPNTGDTVAV